MAEGILKAKVKAAGLSQYISVASAGVKASPIRCRPDLRAQKISLKYGVDISKIRSKRFTDKDYHHDYILVMDDEQRHQLKQLYPEQDNHKVRLLLSYARADGDQQIPDPYYGNVHGFEHVYQLLNEATDAFLTTMNILKNKTE
jgi:protein-tyrosine phosphatase